MTGSTKTTSTNALGGPAIQVLGIPRFVVDGSARAAAAASRPILVELAFAGGDGVGIDTLCSAWPERSRAAVQTSIWRIRRRLGPDSILTSGDFYRIGTSVAVDVDEFEELIHRGLDAVENASPHEADDLLERALSYWQGSPDPVLVTESGSQRRERVIELRAVGIERWAHVCVEIGSPERAIAPLRTLVGDHPLREQAWAALITAHQETGEPTLAAAVATEAVEVIAEAGVEPSLRLSTAMARSRRVAVADRPRPRRSIPEWLEASRRGLEFVGRAEETESLATLLEWAQKGHGVTAVVAGPSGAGKTRLLAETAALASARGMAVWGGRWDRHVRTPHQGIVEALRALVDDTPTGVVAATLLESVAPMPGSTADGVGDRRDLHPSDLPEIFATVSEVFVRATVERPAVLVLDDIQWASRVSLLMLRQLLVSDPTIPLAILVGLNTSVTSDPSTRPLFDGLVRPNRSRWIELGGLEPLEVATLPTIAHAALTIGTDSRELARSIVDYTGGNPLLIDRVLDEPGFIERVGRPERSRSERLPMPARLAAAAGTHLADLDDEVRMVLGTAALIGKDFDLALLQRAVDVPIDASIAHGRAARVMEIHGHRGSFLHDALAEALVDTLDIESRQAAHARIADALEPSADGSGATATFALAHHLGSAGLFVAADRVTDATRRAATGARAQLEFGIAAHFFEVAANHAPVGDAVDLLVAGVDASAIDGDVVKARRLLHQAERLARSGIDNGALAKVAVAACDLSLRSGGFLDADAVQLVRGARERLDSRNDPELYSQLTFLDALGRERIHALIDVARTQPNPRLGIALAERGLELGPLAARPELVECLLTSSSANGRVLGALWDWVVGVQDGAMGLDHAERAEELDGLVSDPTVDEGVRWKVASWRATRAIARGEFRLGGELAERAAQMGQSLADRHWRMHAIGARWSHQGCLEFLTGTKMGNSGRVPGVGRLFGTGAAFSHPWDAHRLAWAGRVDEASTLVDAALAQVRRGLVLGGAGLVRLTLYASAIHALQDATAARALYPELDAQRGRMAVHMDGFIGALEHNASLLAGIAGDIDAAISGLRSASDQAARVGAAPYALLSQMQLVLHLHRRHHDADQVEAATLQSIVLAEADRLGLPRVKQLLANRA